MLLLQPEGPLCLFLLVQSASRQHCRWHPACMTSVNKSSAFPSSSRSVSTRISTSRTSPTTTTSAVSIRASPQQRYVQTPGPFVRDVSYTQHINDDWGSIVSGANIIQARHCNQAHCEPQRSTQDRERHKHHHAWLQGRRPHRCIHQDEHPHLHICHVTTPIIGLNDLIASKVEINCDKWPSAFEISPSRHRHWLT